MDTNHHPAGVNQRIAAEYCVGSPARTGTLCDPMWKTHEFARTKNDSNSVPRNLGDGFSPLPAMLYCEPSSVESWSVSRREASERAEAFERLYTSFYRDIAAYATRRVSVDETDDVVAKIFTVAWRRFDDVPDSPEDRLWLFGVARRCVADQLRGQRRQTRLYTRVLQEQTTMKGGGAAGSDRRYDLALAAMASMKPVDREALQLVLWDGLTHLEAAKVLGCSVNAFELRYRRARNAARAAVNETMSAHETTVDTSTSLVTPADTSTSLVTPLATEGTP